MIILMIAIPTAKYLEDMHRHFNLYAQVQVINKSKKYFYESIWKSPQSCATYTMRLATWSWQHVEELRKNEAHLWLHHTQIGGDRSLQLNHWYSRSADCWISSSWSDQKSLHSKKLAETWLVPMNKYSLISNQSPDSASKSGNSVQFCLQHSGHSGWKVHY